MRKKIYESPKERQKAYRERKRDAGFRRIVVDVPEHVYAFIKGRPSELVAMFIENATQKGLFMDFEQISFSEKGEAGARFVEFRNKEGYCFKITDPEKIKVAEFKNTNDLNQVKKTLIYLLHGKDNYVTRMGNCIFNPEYKLNEFGRSAVQELLGWVNKEDIPICNGRTVKALRYLGFNVAIFG